ncbi:MAG: 50S ribosomal protein L24 [Candidatus Gracilibacteria bacterium]|nr:50S ribosomal protein L24 [bacterium]MDZ4217057.1 50S ribosomal protein L24 [Candidatus Gracilibacteria bacterium]
MKLKVGDSIIVIAGKNKGKTGKITATNEEKNTVIVEKVNMKVKHHKKTMAAPGQKIESEAPLHASNVMIIDPKTNKRSRIGYRILKTGKKERFSKASGEALN